jgi:MFS superfamily sulfate permease-like transporter
LISNFCEREELTISKGLGYAALANVDNVYGLYLALVPAIVYAFLGTSRHLSIGTYNCTVHSISTHQTNGYENEKKKVIGFALILPIKRR